MATVVLVWVGGFLGSIIRYLISRRAQDLLGNPWFPYGTLAVNVIGCIIIGILAGVVDSRGTFSPETRALLFIGFLGGFTTLSAFGYETFGLARDGKFLGASANVALQLSLGLGAVWLGYKLSSAAA